MVAVPLIKLSGGLLNTNPKASIGGGRSNTTVTSDVAENLFDDISRNEALVGRTEYRLIYVYNSSGTPVTGAVLILGPTVADVTFVAVGLDPVGKGDGISSGVGETLITEDQTPTGVKFFGADLDSGDGPWNNVQFPIGFIDAGDCVPIWIKRTSQKGIEQEIAFNLTLIYDSVTLPGEDVDDGCAIGELLNITAQGTGTFLIDTAKIGFSDIGSP